MQVRYYEHIISRTRQMVCYVARDGYKVPRLHNTCVMLSDVPYHNIKTPVFTLRSKPGNITHCLPSTTVMNNLRKCKQSIFRITEDIMQTLILLFIVISRVAFFKENPISRVLCCMEQNVMQIQVF